MQTSFECGPSLADAEDAEVPVVGGEGDVQVVELLAVLVDVGRHPAPVAVVVVVVVVPAEQRVIFM